MEKKEKEIEQNETAPEDKGSQEGISEALESVLNHVGRMGRYQQLLFLAMLPFGFVWSFGYFGQMFIAATPQSHWCLVPELGSLDIKFRRNLSIPGAASGEWDSCRVFDADWAQVLATLQPPAPDTPTTPCQHGWEFEFSDIPYATVVSEREWVCDRADLVPWSQTINFLGSIVGGLLFGRIADRFGRISALVGSNLVGCVGGVATIFTQGFWDFSVCRFLVGMSVDSCFIMMYILVMEYVGTSHRTWIANMSIAMYFGGGCLALPFLARWLADWRQLSLFMSLPMLLVLGTPLLVPESTRWLVSQGKIEVAVKLLKRFERINGTNIPTDVLDGFVKVAKTTKEPNEGLKILFKNSSLRIMLTCLVITFMSIAIVFDILIRLSETLGGDFFITFALSSATEIPSIALLVLLLDRFGRRRIVFLSVSVAGVLSLAAAFVPRGVASVALAVVARFFNNMSYGTIIQWTPELLPTGLRASGVSLVHVSAFAAVMLSPFIVYSERVWESLPLVISAAVCLLGGCLALLLPETMGRPIPQTVLDGEELARTRWRCRNKGTKETSAVDSPPNNTVDARNS